MEKPAPRYDGYVTVSGFLWPDLGERFPSPRGNSSGAAVELALQEFPHTFPTLFTLLRARRSCDWGRRPRASAFRPLRRSPPFLRPGRCPFDHPEKISQKPSHGYEIIKAIEDRLGGAYAPSPGIVYPALTLLEEQGLIRVESTDGPRKLYAITPEGNAELERNRGMAEEIFARIAAINARHGGGPAPQILRAMENLKLALRLRLSQGPLSVEQVARIANLLDEAAKSVEGS
jgi:DNA-binding PadR family transcriptional regulator